MPLPVVSFLTYCQDLALKSLTPSLKRMLEQPSTQFFAGTASQALAQKIVHSLGQPLRTLHVQRFSDGELRPQLDEKVQGAPVCLIQATYPPAEHLVELLLTIDAAQRAGATHITAIVPYLAYARQDERGPNGSAVAAPLVVQLLAAAGLDRLLTCELHSPHVLGAFQGKAEHVTLAPVFMSYLGTLPQQQLVIVAPDAGGVTRARAYADHWQVPLIIADKVRNRHHQVVAVHLSGTVQDAEAVIIDDIVDTGSTLSAVAVQLRAQGARTVRACCAHPVLSGSAHDWLADAPLEEVVVTDTIPLQRPCTKIKVLSAATLLGQAFSK